MDFNNSLQPSTSPLPVANAVTIASTVDTFRQQESGMVKQLASSQKNTSATEDANKLGRERKEKTGQKDTIDLSERLRYYTALHKELATFPDVDQAKIGKLQKALNSGELMPVSLDQLAGSITNFHRKD